MSRATAAAVAAIIVAGGAQGCTRSGNGPSVVAVAQPPSPPTHKHYAHGTGRLQVTITPRTGPVGTTVALTATGCGDPDGRTHAVSFNPGFANTLQAALSHYRQRGIASRLAGRTLTASYTITAADAHAARAGTIPSAFYVQCRDDVAEAHFVIAR